MKRWLLIGLCMMLTVMCLSSCSIQKNHERIMEETAYGACKWGMTREEVFQALSIREDQITGTESTPYGDGVIVSWDQPVYGLKVDSLEFAFDPLEAHTKDTIPRLTSIGIAYPKGTELEDIWESISKVYQEAPAFQVREEYTEEYAVWAKTEQTLASELTQPAKEALRTLYGDSLVTSNEEAWNSHLEGEALVDITSNGKKYSLDSIYGVAINGFNFLLSKSLNAQYPE